MGYLLLYNLEKEKSSFPTFGLLTCTKSSLSWRVTGYGLWSKLRDFLSTGRNPRFVGQRPQEATGAQGTTGHWSLCQG